MATVENLRSRAIAACLAAAMAACGVGCATAAHPATTVSEGVARHMHFTAVQIVESPSGSAAEIGSNVKNFLARLLYREDGFSIGVGLVIELQIVRWEPAIRGYAGPAGHSRADIRPVRPGELTVDVRFYDDAGRKLAEPRFVGQGADNFTGSDFDDVNVAASRVAESIAKFTVDNFR